MLFIVGNFFNTLTNPTEMHYNHIQVDKMVLKRISTFWKHPRERTRHVRFRYGKHVAERSLCEKDGTYLGASYENTA